MYQISVSEVLEKGWEQFKKHGLVLTVIYFCIGLIQSAISNIGAPTIDPQALTDALQSNDSKAILQMYSTNPGGALLSALINAVLTLGLMNAIIMLVSNKVTSVSFDLWKLPLMTYVKYVGVNIIVCVIVGVGLCLCIIPGIYLAARLYFATIRVIDHPDEGIMDTIKNSWEMTKGNVWSLILLEIAFFFIVLIGLCLCCVGIFPATVLYYVSTVVAYLTLSGFYSEPKDELEEV